MLKYWRKMFVLAGILMLLLPVSCDKNNNHLELVDVKNHLEKCGIKIDSIQILRPDVVGADQGVCFGIAGKEVGVYKFNKNIAKQKKRITSIDKEGFVYVLGLKFPVLINGSFMMVGAQQNKEKKKLVAAFRSFE